MSYDFEEINMSEIGLEAAAINKENNLLDIFVSMPKGDGYVLVRFLPPQKGKTLFCSTRIHNLGTKRFHCLRHRKQLPNGIFWLNPSPTNNPNEDCPICQEYSRLWKVSNGLSAGPEQQRIQGQARLIKPIERFYWNVMVRRQVNQKTNTEEKNVGPKILSCGKTLQSIILESINGSELTGRKKLGNITHPVTGRDFRLVKKNVKGTNGSEYPKYDQSSFEDPSILGTEEQIKLWLENMHNLDDLRTLRPRAELISELKSYMTGGEAASSPWEDDSTAAPVSVPVSEKSSAPKTEAKAPTKPVDDISDTIDDDFANALKNING